MRPIRDGPALASGSTAAGRPRSAWILPAHDRAGWEGSGSPQAVADRRNQHVTDILRRAAEARDRRDLDRSIEDDLSIKREAAALLAIVASHAQPEAQSRADDGTETTGRADRPGDTTPGPDTTGTST
jgi:hypothetical protein